jgi:hypothetical protein
MLLPRLSHHQLPLPQLLLLQYLLQHPHPHLHPRFQRLLRLHQHRLPTRPTSPTRTST